MLGEYPDLYGFPELHLFMGDTMQQVIDRESHPNKRRWFGPPGLLRTPAKSASSRTISAAAGPVLFFKSKSPF